MSLQKGLVGHWPLDSNRTANGSTKDVSGHANHGSMSGGITTDRTDSPIGEAMSFDGTDDYIDVPPRNLGSSFTLSSWFKAETLGTGSNTSAVIELSDGNTFSRMGSIRLASDGKLKIFVRTSSGNLSFKSNKTIVTGKYYHSTLTYDGFNVELHIDGSLDKSVSKDLGLVDSITQFSIGRTNDPRYYHGYISDTRVYERALSKDEIRDLYRTREVQRTRPQSGSELAGKVGHWPLDSSSPEDISTKGNDGTLNGGVTTEVPDGPYGRCMSFDGTDDYIKSSDPFSPMGSGGVTTSAWVYLDGDTGSVQNVMRHDDNTIIGWVDASYDNIRGYVKDSNGNWNYLVYPSGPSDFEGEWNHLVTWSDGSSIKIYRNGEQVNSGSISGLNDAIRSLYIGCEGGPKNYWNGEIADVRIYDRALSDREIRSIYSEGVPVPESGLVGHWTLDNEVSGQALDRSPEGNHGTLNGGVTTGVPGKVGKAMEFDGTDDWIDCGSSSGLNPTDEVTVSSWVKVDSKDGNIRRTVRKQSQYVIEKTSSDDIKGWIQDSGGTWHDLAIDHSNYNEDEWFHILHTYDGTTHRMYINGVIGDSRSLSISLNTSTNSLVIGNQTADTANGPWDGVIDDVRVYNRALSPAEVRSLYRTTEPYYKEDRSLARSNKL